MSVSCLYILNAVMSHYFAAVRADVYVHRVLLSAVVMIDTPTWASLHCLHQG